MRAFGVFMATLLAIPLVLALVFWSSFNGLVNRDEGVKQSYAQVQNVMQRQAELIPNLVETVKAEAAFERGTLTQVTEARGKLTAVSKLDPEKLANDPELQKKLIEAQQATTQALISLNAVREAYPQLQANQGFRSLMTELSGSQNRIAVERRRNQLAVEDYNRSVRGFPTNLVANWGGFSQKPYFQAEETSQRAPQVKF